MPTTGGPLPPAGPIARGCAGCGSGAFLGGGLFFALGFFGPIVFLPSANQGPLLGIFITGPMGFALGGIVGLVAGAWKSPAALAAGIVAALPIAILTTLGIKEALDKDTLSGVPTVVWVLIAWVLFAAVAVATHLLVPKVADQVSAAFGRK